MSEEAMTLVETFINALNGLVERKKPLSIAPINQLKEQVSSLGSVSISMSTIVEKLVMAGYNIEDIRWFLFASGIIHNTDEWVRRKMQVERAIVLSKLKQETGEMQ